MHTAASIQAATGRACRERGAAALFVTLVLFVAMVLTAVFVNRNLVFEQRSSANQVRSTQAFEAAEAGLEWAIAQLNGTGRIGADCRASADPAATSFRARYLRIDSSDSRITAATWLQAGAASALHPTCVRSAGGWECSCPSQGLPVLDAPAGPAPAPAFTLTFIAAARPGVVRVSATGCTSLAGVCRPGSGTRADANATLEVALGRLPALRAAPAAAITTRGAFDADTAALGVHNPDPATGIAIHAGGPIRASQARLTVPGGASTADALIGNDAALAALSTERFFMTYFGVAKSAWKNLPGVTHIDCSVACPTALATALADAADNALIWLDGDAALSGPMTIGSAERPVALVVNGTLHLDGAVALHGLIHAAALRWDTPAIGAVIRGALLSETGYQGSATPELVHDAKVLAALRASGSFARVNGSWRDF